jgi:hypothetical protein
MRTKEAMMPRALIKDHKTYREFPGAFGVPVHVSFSVAYG